MQGVTQPHAVQRVLHRAVGQQALHGVARRAGGPVEDLGPLDLLRDAHAQGWAERARVKPPAERADAGQGDPAPIGRCPRCA